jgi:hypothetical protein
MKKQQAIHPPQPGPEGPTFSGYVYQVNAKFELEFILAIVNGQAPPQETYAPWPGLEVNTFSINELLPIPIPGPSAITQADGSFAINQPPATATVPGGTPSDVRFGLVITEGSFPLRPLYRSDLSLSVGAAEATELNIWLLPFSIGSAEGLSAGSVSGILTGSGLPGNTRISASPSGLSFSGSGSGADVKFGISIVPDTSFNLATYLDLLLSSWNIHVGWPADWCTNANDILVEIVQGLQEAAASMNKTVLKKIESDAPLANPAKFFTSVVSVTFMDITFPTQHTWPMSNTSDSTVVVTGDLCIGYPRSLSSDPSRIPVIEAQRLSRPLRPMWI